MIHYLVGNVGHFSVILAFVTALVSMFAYWQYTAQNEKSWLNLARGAFALHALAVLGIVASLFWIIYNHYFEYHYAWSHSSLNLPTHFMISCFWEGQEGSFLLWIFWHVCLGLVLMRKAGEWEAPVMAVFAMVQAFLVSMILGVVFFDSFKIGSSPFMLLREVMPDTPIFRKNPDFIPTDGNGLNPLLQNYWMVIHPPTLFLGFAFTLVPFSYCMAALQNGKYKEWIQPAMVWNLAGAGVLGIGIVMGAYWAYETLNFGGYWNWDPVENAVYIPWLVMVGSIHTMIIFQKNNTALKTAMLLVISTFILILYSTFLTRSGILGNASVHSFTDLGLSGQLLIYLLAFVALAIFFLIRNWKKIPADPEEVSVYSREFWIFMGATTLCLAAFQVLIPTSIPVFNAISQYLGFESNVAPPTDQVAFYTKFQMWFGATVALLSGTGQFFWWKRMDWENLKKALIMPLIITFLLASLALILFKISNWKYIIVLTVSIYSVVSNSFVLVRLGKMNFRLAGGSVAHIGIALMLLGILASAGYDKIISQNTTGLLYNRDFSDEINKENLLLFRHQPQKMNNYTLVYKGMRIESGEVPCLFDKEKVLPTEIPFKVVAMEDISCGEKIWVTKGDTLQIYHENTYYEVEYAKENEKPFSLFPRVQQNPQMGMAVSPALLRGFERDIYTHVTALPNPEEEIKWSKPEKFELHLGDTFFINDYVAILDNVQRGEKMTDEDVNVFGSIRILDRTQTYTLKPIYYIKGNMVGTMPDLNKALGIKITLTEIRPEQNLFVLEVTSSQKDWIILKAVEKPFINVLWIGTVLMGIGFGIAVWRRF